MKKKFMIRDSHAVTRGYIFRKKQRFHQNLARLPFEEKIKILIRLQEIAAEIRPGTGKRIWGRKGS